MNLSSASRSLDLAGNYQRDGYLVVRGLFSPRECEELKAEALRVLREKAKPNASVYVGVSAASPMYCRLASDNRLVSILDKIMPDGVMFMSDKFVLKSGTLTFPTPWHYDAAYWPNTRPKLSVWIPLDDATKDNGTLKVVRGSHKQDFSHEAVDVTKTGNEFGRLISEVQWKPEDEVICELGRGGAIIFTDRTLHASCSNASGLDRYAIIGTYHAPLEDEPFDKGFAARHVIIPRR